MTSRNKFDCDICKRVDITEGLTLIFEHNMDGATSSKLDLKHCVEGLHISKDAPDVDHICKHCLHKIQNPKNIEKSRL